MVTEKAQNCDHRSTRALRPVANTHNFRLAVSN